VPDPAALLQWYDCHRRVLPWRTAPGERPDPYRIWLSEIMLQQTTVAAVAPYYARFLRLFPTVQALAAAEDAAVMAAWAGLGYYARARNMLACARAVAARGGFPATEAGLRALPGIGPYTAAAIAAITFGAPAVPVDGNVERVLARVFRITVPMPAAKRPVSAHALAFLADARVRARPGDFAQSLFDLGATICTPRRPACAMCPWRIDCTGRDIAEDLPVQAPKRTRPVRHGVHFVLRDAAGQVLLRRRPPTGLLGGMTEFPGPPWRTEPFQDDEIAAAAPQSAAWRKLGEVRHGLTHFELRLAVLFATVPRVEAEGFLVPADCLAEEALPSVMRKVAALAGDFTKDQHGPI
jgi:A/G-specific adenine glycosylase